MFTLQVLKTIVIRELWSFPFVENINIVGRRMSEYQILSAFEEVAYRNILHDVSAVIEYNFLQAFREIADRNISHDVSALIHHVKYICRRYL